ncbi:hypothetical protein VP424E501_P0204 [Vibrio phage 424E50-1]|nr:hypothetical protein VP424E501_P0204 [Vibrio phage 424E50-1]
MNAREQIFSELEIEYGELKLPNRFNIEPYSVRINDDDIKCNPDIEIDHDGDLLVNLHTDVNNLLDLVSTGSIIDYLEDKGFIIKEEE